MFFDDPGSKLKVLAKVCFWIEAVVGVIYGASLIKIGNTLGDIMIFSPFFAWIANIVLYGFGELIEYTSENRFKVDQIYKEISKNNASKDAPAHKAPEKEWNENIPRL